jgi:DHA1 family multidrug resistance protein-like MFS transporter
MDSIRDAPIGQLIRLITKNKVLLYPEEKPDFVVPAYYTKGGYDLAEPKDAIHDHPTADRPAVSATRAGTPPNARSSTSSLEDLEKIPTAKDGGPHFEAINTTRSRRSHHSHVSRTASRADLEQALSTATAERGPSRPIVPTRTTDGVILVDWYTTDDSDNPQNWALGKKSYATFLIW